MVNKLQPHKVENMVVELKSHMKVIRKIAGPKSIKAEAVATKETQE